MMVYLTATNGAKEKLAPDLQLAAKAYIEHNIKTRWAGPHFKIATDFIEKEKYRAAIVHLIQGLRQLPTSQSAISLLGSCFAECGEYDQAQRVRRLGRNRKSRA